MHPGMLYGKPGSRFPELSFKGRFSGYHLSGQGITPEEARIISFIQNIASFNSRAWSKIDNMVRNSDQFLVVFDQKYRISMVPEFSNRFFQEMDIMAM